VAPQVNHELNRRQSSSFLPRHSQPQAARKKDDNVRFNMVPNFLMRALCGGFQATMRISHERHISHLAHLQPVLTVPDRSRSTELYLLGDIGNSVVIPLACRLSSELVRRDTQICQSVRHSLLPSLLCSLYQSCTSATPRLYLAARLRCHW
jgi:hypothetical protein